MDLGGVFLEQIIMWNKHNVLNLCINYREVTWLILPVAYACLKD